MKSNLELNKPTPSNSPRSSPMISGKSRFLLLNYLERESGFTRKGKSALFDQSYEPLKEY